VDFGASSVESIAKGRSVDKVKRKAILGLAELICILGVLLFVPAWTLDFWQGWVCLIVFGLSSGLITAYLWKNDPKLMERRVKGGPGAEKEKIQKLIQLIAAVLFIGAFVIPSLDHRLGWSHVPVLIVIVGDVLVALGFFIVFIVFRENTYTAAIIEVVADQKVISTGPYAIVRHPMYAGALALLFGTPLALGSWWGLLMFIAMTMAIVWRLRDEEKFLSHNLQGYSEYCTKVRYRLVPLVY
jgi:protein-S-isoprenylcysteine O-methyltransferase Ste14